MIRASYKKYTLDFKVPSATSRSVLEHKISYFIRLEDIDNKEIFGIGEAAPLDGLSLDAHASFEFFLEQVCKNIDEFVSQIDIIRLQYPSIAFAIECALLQLKRGASDVLFESDFTRGIDAIPINGLIWIGSIEYMKKQIKEKLQSGYQVLKLKIGANDFEEEIQVLKWIREEYKSEQLTLRLDANGAFSAQEALEKLKRLSDYDIHSIEQPIKQGQLEAMATLCQQSAIPIALDEELITVVRPLLKQQLLEILKPPYIILKPTLHGGIAGCEEWIRLAKKNNIGYWITSALESNVGLSAIAQWTASMSDCQTMTHGLGTGQLFTNNLDSPLYIEQGRLHYHSDKHLDYSKIL